MNHVPSLAGEIVPLRKDVIKIGKVLTMDTMNPDPTMVGVHRIHLG